MTDKNYKKLLLVTAMTASLNAQAGVELMSSTINGEETKVTLGGYAKVDVRHVQGDIAYQDYWVANLPSGNAVDTSHTGFNVKESRLILKYNTVMLPVLLNLICMAVAVMK